MHLTSLIADVITKSDAIRYSSACLAVQHHRRFLYKPANYFKSATALVDARALYVPPIFSTFHISTPAYGRHISFAPQWHPYLFIKDMDAGNPIFPSSPSAVFSR
jgi:hypothetical protein